MTTFLLTWNPSTGDGGWTDGNYAEAADLTRNGGSKEGRWSTGIRKTGIARGDDLYLLVQGVTQRGIIGHGYARDIIFDTTHWKSNETGKATYVPVEWDVLLDDPDLLPIADLKARVPMKHRWEPRRSGTIVDEPEASLLHTLWADHLRRLGHPPPPVATKTGQVLTGGHTERRVRARIGQGGFRDFLVARYGEQCAVTGPAPLAALEAAHLYPYADHGIHDPDGGLLLRSDIHTLFDKGLIMISPKGTIGIHHSLKPYRGYSRLDGQQIHVTLNKAQQRWLKNR